MSAPPTNQFLDQQIKDRVAEIDRQLDQQQAENLKSMANSGLCGGGMAQMPVLHPLPPAPYSDHQRRMNDMVSTDPQMKETLTALCSLLGYEIRSMALTTGLDIRPVNGEDIAWRVVSRKWALYVQWIDNGSPSFEVFKQNFAKLSDAIATKREKLLKDGKPLPAEPVDPEEAARRVYQQIAAYAQQAAANGFEMVIDQNAVLKAAMQNQGTAHAPPPQSWGLPGC